MVSQSEAALRSWERRRSQQTHKTCTTCKRHKVTAEFRPRGNGLRSSCKVCENDLQRDYQQRKSRERTEQLEQGIPVEKRRASSRVRGIHLFGLSDDEFKRVSMAQNDSCSICGNPPRRTRLSIDHNHTTGEVRGLLCDLCNTMLGHARDDTAVLQAAIDYLTNPPLRGIILHRGCQSRRTPKSTIRCVFDTGHDGLHCGYGSTGRLLSWAESCKPYYHIGHKVQETLKKIQQQGEMT